MGFHEFLRLRFIPSCFKLIPNLPAAPPVPAVNLITLDGRVRTYNRSVPVAELMAEFPKHLVCRSDALCVGRKIPALSERDRLEPSHNYFLLPIHFFQSDLTFLNVASFVTSRSNCGGSVGRRGFEVMRTPSGCVRVQVSDEFISHLVEEGKLSRGEEKEQEKTRLCSTPQLEKDYVQLRSGRWEPKLETIRESSQKEKRRRMRIPLSLVAKRRNNGDCHIEKPSPSAATTPWTTYCRIIKCHK